MSIEFDPYRLLFDLCDRPKSHPAFVAVPVISVRPRTLDPEDVRTNWQDKVLAAIRGGGACVYVPTPGLFSTKPTEDKYFEDVECRGYVFTNELLRATGDASQSRALDLARLLRRIWSFKAPGSYNRLDCVEFREVIGDELPETLASKLTALGGVGWLVRCTTQMQDETITQVATPAMSCAALTVPQAVTITCATAGATIYYTTNGGYPGNGNSQAQSGASPLVVNVATAGYLRAAAQKNGVYSSDIATAQFS